MSGLCFTTVPQGTVKVLERFGRFKEIAQPGFHFLCCCVGDSVAGTISLRVQQLDVHCDTKSKDNVFLKLTVSVQYQVVKEALYDAFYKLTNSRTQITSYVYDSIRSTVPKMDLDDVFTAKEEIAQHVKHELQKEMGTFGFQIIQALVIDIVPDQAVRNAMNAINAAQRTRVAAREQAEAQKVSVVKAAEAEAEAKYLQGQGIARQRQAIVNGLRESVVQFSHDVNDINSRDVIEMMMITQYFDMLRDVGVHGKTSAVFLPHGPGEVGNVAAQIRNGFLQAQANHA